MALSLSPFFVAFNIGTSFGAHISPRQLFVDPSFWYPPVVSTFLRTKCLPPLCVVFALHFPSPLEAPRSRKVFRGNWKPARAPDSVAKVSRPRDSLPENAFQESERYRKYFLSGAVWNSLWDTPAKQMGRGAPGVYSIHHVSGPIFGTFHSAHPDFLFIARRFPIPVFMAKAPQLRIQEGLVLSGATSQKGYFRNRVWWPGRNGSRPLRRNSGKRCASFGENIRNCVRSF